MTRLLLITTALVMFVAAVQADGEARLGPCGATETAFFACQTAKQKWIALCGTPPAIQYRFGPSDKPELRYPENPTEGVQKLLFAHYSRFQTDRIEIGFTNQGVDYAVFDYAEEGKRRAGVRVTTPDGKEREVTCAGRIASRLGDLKKILRCDADNALNGGSCP